MRFHADKRKQGVSMYIIAILEIESIKRHILLNYGQIPLTKSKYLDYATKEQHRIRRKRDRCCNVLQRI